jgi:hypothetical protein
MGCVYLKQGDKCDKCGQGIMRATGRRYILHEKRGVKYEPSSESIELECDKCGHRHVNLNVYNYISIEEKVEVSKNNTANKQKP